MKILVISDTHHRVQRLLDTVAKHEKEIGACIHLGDGLSDAAKLRAVFPRLVLYAVPGNCDPGFGQAGEGLETFDGVPVFYTHGHQYGVKESLGRLCRKARDCGATVALYGHTHIPHYAYQNGVHLFNPGSLTMPRFGPATYGLLSTGGGAPSFEVCEFELQ